LARSLGAASCRLPELGRKIAGARPGAVGDIAARLPCAARKQRRGEQGQRERPFQPPGEHGVGEQLALPSPPAQGLAPGVRRERALRDSMSYPLTSPLIAE
jgi:hypothetical protein